MIEEQEDYYSEWTKVGKHTYKYKQFEAYENTDGSWSLFHYGSWDSTVPDFEYIKDYVEILEQYNSERDYY